MEKIYATGRILFYTVIAILLSAPLLKAQDVKAWGYTCGFDLNDPTYPIFNFFNYDIATGEPTIVAPASDCPSSGSDFFTGEAVGGYYYAITNGSRELIRMTEAGECSLVGTVSPIDNRTVSALSHDPSTGITYLVTVASGSSTLYTIDLSTGATTLINANMPVTAISMPIDAQGNAYAIDLFTDQIIPINLTDGTVAGPGVNLNINLNFAQDMDFDCDDTSNTLYGIVYGGGGDSRYGTIDPTTGIFTEIRFLGVETCGFSIGPAAEPEELPVMTPWKGIAFGALVLGIATLLLVGRMKF